MSVPEPFLTFAGVTKTFGPVRALDDVSFGVPRGRVHALLGENGAGKSTLLRVLSGAHEPTRGVLRLDGRERHFTSPAHAFASGVAVIYQELHLVPEMNVAENLFLGHMPARLGVVDLAAMHARATELLARVAPDIDSTTRVGDLSLGARQMVEIAKALSRGAEVIAFDEPTSSLSATESARLFDVIRELRDRGAVVLYVTHRLDEVFALCDSATVLRDGKHVRSFDTLDGVTPDDLVRCMVGRDIGDVYAWTPRPTRGPALEVDDLRGPGLAAPIAFTVARGEIVGVFGLVGAGRTELLRVLFGAVRRTGGTVRVHGTPKRIDSPRDAIAAGVLLCPEDRRKEGLFPGLSVRDNLNVSARRDHAHVGLVLDGTWEHDNALAQIARLSIKTASQDHAVSTLSGGNQQKVIFGRWLAEDVKVLLLDEPTRGVDVGARSEIYAILQELARAGVGVLMVSSDLAEVLGACDRVLVMRQGRLAGEFTRDDATEERVLECALPRAAPESAT